MFKSKLMSSPADAPLKQPDSCPTQLGKDQVSGSSLKIWAWEQHPNPSSDISREDLDTPNSTAYLADVPKHALMSQTLPPCPLNCVLQCRFSTFSMVFINYTLIVCERLIPKGDLSTPVDISAYARYFSKDEKTFGMWCREVSQECPL